MSEDKPEGATHLQNEKPPDDEIEPEELLEVAARAFSARASIPDPTDQILLSPNYTPGWPAGAPEGVTIHTEEGWHDPSVAWLRNPASFAGQHFCIRRDGKVVQLVWTTPGLRDVTPLVISPGTTRGRATTIGTPARTSLGVRICARSISSQSSRRRRGETTQVPERL